MKYNEVIVRIYSAEIIHHFLPLFDRLTEAMEPGRGSIFFTHIPDKTLMMSKTGHQLPVIKLPLYICESGIKKHLSQIGFVRISLNG